MTSIKREWNPCKICERYYNEECDNKIRTNCDFKIINDFHQFLSEKKLRISKYDNYLSSYIYFVTDDYIIPNNNECIDLRNESIEYTINFVSTTKFNKKIFVRIDEEYRNAIYNNLWVMKFYHVKMLLNKEFSKSSIKYRLDQRFSIEYY